MALYDLAFQAVARAAILAALSANSNTTPVLAYATPDQALPYIHIGESEQQDEVIGHWITVTIHTWDESEGPHGVKVLQSYVHTALHGKNLDSGGVCYTACRQEYSTVNLDPNEETWHGVQRFRVLASVIP